MATDQFLQKNCGPHVVVKEGSIKYLKATWGITYGNIIFDPQKQPNAAFLWQIHYGTEGNGNIRIGIISSWNKFDRDFFPFTKDNGYSYVHGWQGFGKCWKRINGKDTYLKDAPKPKPGDCIEMRLIIPQKKIQFYSNAQFLWDSTINVHTKYKAVVLMCNATCRLSKFEAIWNINVLIEGVLKTLYDDSEIGYGDVAKLIARHWSFG